ncbi:MAG: ribonuclease III domain-containing protein [Clostridia bacterium]|nr:ribonuclease III domain-containing protein [Clostridia bacterium]MDR3644804.1 ribonuclease III domain-containing protein [Clostridia bacterium]
MSDNGISPSEKEKYRQLSPVTLAFLGDAVYELKAREQLVRQGGRPAGTLHKMTVALVRAAAQAEAAGHILPLLTPEEQDILRRGRNASTSHVPKNASPASYRRATGLEALFGYLFLCGEQQRIDEIFDVILGMYDRAESVQQH